MTDINTRPVLNIGATLERTGNDPARLRDIFSFSVSELQTWSQKLSAMISSGNTEQIARMAHGFKGAAATLGAERMQELMRSIELSAKGGSLDEVSTAANAVPEQVRMLIDAIQEYLNA